MLIFDIETDGLLDTMTTIHCMSISDGHHHVVGYRPEEVEKGVKRLWEAVNNGEGICGHNIINFDIPAIHKVFPWFDIPRDKRCNVVDTLVLARLIFSNIKDGDGTKFKQNLLPGPLIGSHTLKAYGYRMAIYKGTYAEDTEDAWACFNEEMLEYNKQDVVVTEALYRKEVAKKYPKEAIDLEHKAQWLMFKQEQNGFPFDVEAAEQLDKVLRERYEYVRKTLQSMAPPIPDKIFVPKRDNKRLGYKAGVPIQRYKAFNPTSRQQIEWVIRQYYGYDPKNEELYNKPDEVDEEGNVTQKGRDRFHTKDDRLKIDESTFHFMATDENAPEAVRKLAPLFEEQLMLKKRLGQLSDGTQAWLKCVKEDGKIHGRVNPNGAISGRATHSQPNVTQVPHNSSPYGKECRSLFGVPTGWTQVGVDACGLELRCLSHFLEPYDHGAYAHEVVHGDIHTANQKAAGLPTRDNAKTFIYAFLYGAGDAKMGKIVGGDAKEGKRLKQKFLKATPAISELRKAIQNALIAEMDKGKIIEWRRKYLRGLDKRRLYVRSLHSALNLLLQSAGALICKYWIVRTEERLLALGLKHGWDGDFALMAWVHDEQQIACRTDEIADIVIREAQQAMRDTQKHFKFRVQLDTDGMKGKNWYDCH